MFFVVSLRLSDHKVAFSSSFFFFTRIFSLFSPVFHTSKLLEFKEFNKTIIIIPFALVGYETGYSLVGYLPSNIQCVLME